MELPIRARVEALVTPALDSATPAEIEAMFGPEMARSLNIVNHDAFDPGQNVYIGQTPAGKRALVNRRYLEADKRIVVGFIEPHFFAGFSGGAKGVIPALASIDTIISIHGFDLIANPLSTWGTVEENPIRCELEAMVAHCPPEFMVNVTLNSDKAITGMFVGDYIQAHRAGCRRSREEAMQPVRSRFPLVITSNSGFPLDQNLYQTIKGISAAARITEPGGTILVASECSDGLPDHGNFGPLMKQGRTPHDILQGIVDLPEEILDQWEAQVYAYLMKEYDIRLFSAMDASTVRACKLGVVGDRVPGVATVVCALDNLCKGSSGQAIQNANLMLGVEETAGLMLAPVYANDFFMDGRIKRVNLRADAPFRTGAESLANFYTPSPATGQMIHEMCHALPRKLHSR